MTDITQGDDNESERSQIANRYWIDGTGKETSEEKAVAVSYEFLGRTKKGVTIQGDGKAYRYPIFAPGTRDGMLAGFGALQLMGNICNTWMNDKGDKAPLAHDAIAERFELLDTGVWVDRTGVGARVDKPTMAQAIVNVGARKGKTLDVASVLAKLESDEAAFKAARDNAEFKNEYSALRGRTVKTVDEVLAAF